MDYINNQMMVLNELIMVLLYYSFDLKYKYNEKQCDEHSSKFFLLVKLTRGFVVHFRKNPFENSKGFFLFSVSWQRGLMRGAGTSQSGGRPWTRCSNHRLTAIMEGCPSGLWWLF